MPFFGLHSLGLRVPALLYAGNEPPLGFHASLHPLQRIPAKAGNRSVELMHDLHHTKKSGVL